MIIKDLIKPIAGLLLGILPLPFSLFLVRKIPKLAGVFPSKRKILFKKYLGDIKVNIDTDYVIEKGMLAGRYDRVTLSIIDRIVKPGDFCLDIGANAGAISFALAKKVGIFGKVIAFEPGPRIFERLKANISLNPGMEDIIYPVHKGISERPSELYWKEHKGQPGNGSIIPSFEPGAERVLVTTIDEHFLSNNYKRLDFVKIDVETMEYEVIKGGMNTWKRFQPVLYYETIKDFEIKRKKPVFLFIENILADLGYRFYKVSAHGQTAETRYPELSVNTLAIPDTKMDRIKKNG